MIAYRAHYESVGERMIQGRVGDWFARWLVPMQMCLGLGDNLSLVDIGCGDGDIARRFAELRAVKSIVMVDVALPTITKAHWWYRLPGVVAWAEALPFRSQAFDVALLIAILEHVLNPKPVIQEAERVARHIIAVAPAVEDSDPDHVRVFDLQALTHQRKGLTASDGLETFAYWKSPWAGAKK